MHRIYSLAAVTAAVPLVRLAARDVGSVLVPDRVGDLELIVSELCTNAIQHPNVRSGRSIDVLFDQHGERVRVSVRDPGPGFDSPPGASASGLASGWGLCLVDHLADRWGSFHEWGSFVVWAEVRSCSAADGPRRGAWGGGESPNTGWN